MLSTKLLINTNLHRESVDWHNRVLTNGGRVSKSTLKSVSDFCYRVDAAGIRSKFLRLSLMCGNDLTACRTPLYRGGSISGTQYGNTIDGNIGPFVSGDYSEAAGLTGNGSKVLDTGLELPTAYTFGCEYNNVHLGVYSRDGNGVDFTFGHLDYQGAGDYSGLVINASYTGDTQLSGYQDINNNPANVMTAGAAETGDNTHILAGQKNSRGYGFHLAEFPNSNTGVYTRNGVDITNGTVCCGSIGLVSFQNATTFSTPLVALGYSNNVVTNYDTFDVALEYYGDISTIAAYSVGTAFASSGARSAFNNAMANFQNALGRANTTNYV